MRSKYSLRACLPIASLTVSHKMCASNAHPLAVPAAMGDQQEGLKLLKGALGILQHSMGENYPAAGEARFYIALTHASNPLLEAERREIYKELEQVS